MGDTRLEPLALSDTERQVLQNRPRTDGPVTTKPAYETGLRT